MITVAIGRPTATAMAIVDVIAESKSSSGCTLSSSDMNYSTLCLEPLGKWCSMMVNKVLTPTSEPNRRSIHRPTIILQDHRQGRRRPAWAGGRANRMALRRRFN
jgi:hypothetical protein